MDNENYISPNKITKQYDITSGTLRRWALSGKIRCLRPNGGKRIYNVEDVKKIFTENNKEDTNNKENTNNQETQNDIVQEKNDDIQSVLQNLKKCIESETNMDCIDNLENDLEDIKTLLIHMKSK